MLLTLELLQLFGESGDGAQTGAATVAGESGATQTETVAGSVDVDAEFDSLVGKGGKYAESFKKKEEAIRKKAEEGFKGRYKGFKATEDKANALQKFVDTIAEDYRDVDKNDLEALEKAYLTDERRFSDKAYEDGKSAKEMAQDAYTKRRLAKYEAQEKADKERKAKEAEAKKFFDKISGEEKDMKKKYPDFDLNAELASESFRNLIKSGASLESAYWAEHKDDLVERVVKQTQTATAENIAKKGNRPVEGAASVSAPSVSKIDYSKLSREEFMKLWNG